MKNSELTNVTDCDNIIEFPRQAKKKIQLNNLEELAEFETVPARIRRNRHGEIVELTCEEYLYFSSAD